MAIRLHAWQRPHSDAYPSRGPASDRFQAVLGQALRHQPQDRGQVAYAHLDARCSMSRGIASQIFLVSKSTWQLRYASKGIDLMGRLLEAAPKLSRSALHRWLQRYGISRQPATHVPRRHGKFEETTLGVVHIDSVEMKDFQRQTAHVCCHRPRHKIHACRVL